MNETDVMLDTQEGLHKAGSSIICDATPSSVILAQIASQAADVIQQVTLLVRDPDHATTCSVERHLLDHGIESNICSDLSSLGGMHQNTVISLLDLQGPSCIYTADDDRFEPLIRNICSFRSSILWLLPATQTSCTNPRPSMMLGLARTIRAKHGLDLTTVKVDVTTTEGALEALLNIYRTVLAMRRTIDSHPTEAEGDAVYEYAIEHDGAVKVPRMRWSSLSSDLIDCDAAVNSSGTPSGFSAADPKLRSDVSYLHVG